MMQHLELQIDDMHCDGCVARVTRALTSVPGVQVDEVRVGSARLHINPQQTTPERIIEMLVELGYPARVAANSER